MYCGLCGKAVEVAASYSTAGVPRCPECAAAPPPPPPGAFAVAPPLTPPTTIPAAPRDEGSGFASAAIAMGAIGLSTSFFVLGGVLGLMGLALGMVSLVFRQAGRPMAWTGIGLSVAAVVIGTSFGYVYYQALDEQDLQTLRRAFSGETNVSAEAVTPVKTSEWVGVEAPDLTVTTLDGEEFHLADLRGRRVIVDVWATWCGPCIREIPHFQRLHNETSSDELVILGLSFEEEQVIREFLTETEMEYAVAAGDYKEVAAPFNAATAIPTTFFIDREGVIDAVETGYRDYETLLALSSGENTDSVAAPLSSAGPAPKGAESEHGSEACSHTALMHAAMRADRRALRRLVAGGQQLEERDEEGMTALMHASARGLEGNVLMLLDLGARLETRDEKQRTALIHAATHGRVWVLERLMDRGASRHAKDAYGKTAIDWARERQHVDAVGILSGRKSS